MFEIIKKKIRIGIICKSYRQIIIPILIIFIALIIDNILQLQ